MEWIVQLKGIVLMQVCGRDISIVLKLDARIPLMMGANIDLAVIIYYTQTAWIGLGIAIVGRVLAGWTMLTRKSLAPLIKGLGRNSRLFL